jgi:hypothetical protein
MILRKFWEHGQYVLQIRHRRFNSDQRLWLEALAASWFIPPCGSVVSGVLSAT